MSAFSAGRQEMAKEDKGIEHPRWSITTKKPANKTESEI
jgi:hypothetical protein